MCHAEHFERQNLELVAAVDLIAAQGYTTREHDVSVHEPKSLVNEVTPCDSARRCGKEKQNKHIFDKTHRE